jgi:hypothetical protein
MFERLKRIIREYDPPPYPSAFGEQFAGRRKPGLSDRATLIINIAVVCLAVVTLAEMSFVYRFAGNYRMFAFDLHFLPLLFIFRRWGVSLLYLCMYCALFFDASCQVLSSIEDPPLKHLYFKELTGRELIFLAGLYLALPYCLIRAGIDLACALGRQRRWRSI